VGGFRTAFIIKEEQEVPSAMTSGTILDLDLRKVLSKVGERHKVRLPRDVLALD